MNNEGRDMLDYIRKELGERDLCKSDRYFSMFWMGASACYYRLIKNDAAKPSVTMLLRLSEKLNANGIRDLGSKLYSYAMQSISK
jgi:hypothetical protein